MRRHRRRIACVGSLLDQTRAQYLTRRTGNLSGGGGEYRGGHCHQRKLFFPVPACRRMRLPDIRRLNLPDIRRIICAGEPAGLVSALGASVGFDVERRGGATAPDLLLARPVFPAKRGPALGELPALSFWKDWLFAPSP